MSSAYICDAIRTPFGRYGGVFKDIRADDLGAIPLRALLARHPALDLAAIDDVIYGCANQSGEDSRNVARMSALLAGLPVDVPGVTINRLCASGMDAVGTAARAIRSGEVSVMIAGGVESMTRAPLVMAKAESAFSRSTKLEDSTIGWRFINTAMQVAYGVDSMPETAEHVASDYRISRVDQDLFAWRSQQRYAKAQGLGWLKSEIVAVTLPVMTASKRTSESIIDADEHPRADTTLESLAKLKTIVRPDGSVTAGNASGINDGACALLLASAAAAQTHGLTPIARMVGMASVGIAPRIMGMGAAPAARKVLALTKLTLAQMDVIELNEAFAAQSLAVLRELNLADDDPRVNAWGGAIAIGHPLGASGARLITTALYQLQHTGGRYALCTMCVGVGQGVAVVIERI